MITFLTSPKPFIGKTEKNQVRAIQSWLRIDPDIEVFIFGKAQGSKEVAQQLNVRHVEKIEINEFGTPLFHAITDHAAKFSKHSFHVYINCDILATRQFRKIPQLMPNKQFLAIGQRIDLNENTSINTQNWKKELVEELDRQNVQLHAPSGSDYFCFPSGLWNDLGEVAIGRGGYDNALLAYCFQRSIPVIDITFENPIFHQFHDYSHIKGGKVSVFRGEEAKRNFKLCHDMIGLSLEDANWILKNKKLHRSHSRHDYLRAAEVKWRLENDHAKIADLIHFARRIGARLGWSRTKSLKFDALVKHWMTIEE